MVDQFHAGLADAAHLLAYLAGIVAATIPAFAVVAVTWPAARGLQLRRQARRARRNAGRR